GTWWLRFWTWRASRLAPDTSAANRSWTVSALSPRTGRASTCTRFRKRSTGSWTDSSACARSSADADLAQHGAKERRAKRGDQLGRVRLADVAAVDERDRPVDHQRAEISAATAAAAGAEPAAGVDEPDPPSPGRRRDCLVGTQVVVPRGRRAGAHGRPRPEQAVRRIGRLVRRIADNDHA